ncbi:7-carboxy-7-deazaguanine synthase QueE [Microtetraspora malaysiensis]|uniref:7-carboxy-7-deazaguanine synthase n=1 Tax=Microtetraspora malaysiensis TaxID=161358 RepID=A0ABW6SNC3_9ACTN
MSAITQRPVLLRMAEVFGPTFQGEGPSVGRLAAFIRLSNCNLACTWCDTPHTWDWRRFDRAVEQYGAAPGDVLGWAARQPARLFVITGGEPLVQARRLPELVDGLLALGGEVEIETNGTIAPPEPLLSDRVVFNVSPKLSGSGMPRTRRIRPDVLREFAASGRARFKFVAGTLEELDEIAVLVDESGLAPVWVMPEGTTSRAVLERMRELADAVLARGWNLTTRMHVLLWEDERGR